MTESKKQIWLRPDQVELTASCLLYVQGCLDKDHASGAHAKVAGPFTYHRISEILGLLGQDPS